MRQRLVKAMSDFDAVPIENKLRAGTPDVEFINGWIECKWRKFWPKSADTRPVRFPHPLSKEQGLWLRRRALKGGVTLVAAQVSRDWFFFDGIDIKDYFGKMTKPEMIDKALLHMGNGLDKDRLKQWLMTL